MRHLTFLLIPLLIAACSTSPLGRRQFKLVSDEQMNEMGVASFNELKTKTPETRDTRASEYVSCVARNITSVMGGGNWEVRTFEDKSVNAFALPGGKIGVNTGLLKVATTQDQLAAVIGHEVAHVIAGHSSERVSESMAAQLGLGVVEASTGVNGEMLGIATNVLLLLPHSRAHESEADLLGLDYMAKAGFDPRASITLWQNMRASAGQKPPELLSTHPSDATRITHLEQRLPIAMPLYEQARAGGRRPAC
ncbi:MAG TPA: M48 family metallopeptidase [Verrucomicrobiae bacterium]|nr:M48 family metallopeptidase [Verrucomicrobiae bacterium]